MVLMVALYGGNAVNRTCEEERGGGHGTRCEMNRFQQAGAVWSPLFFGTPLKLSSDCRQCFQPCYPSAVLYVGFSLHWLLLFQTWSDQPGTVYLSYLARRYPCVRTDRAPKISVSFSDTQKDKGCPTHWQNGDLFSRLCWLWIAFGAKARHLLGWPKSLAHLNSTTEQLNRRTSCWKCVNVCYRGWCSN